MSKVLISVEEFEQEATKMGLLVDKVVDESFAPLYKSHITRECWKQWQSARELKCKSQELPDIMAMLDEPRLFVGIYAGDDPHTDEPHISWVKASEQMEPGDRLYIVKKSKVQHDDNKEKEYTYGHWKTKGDN